MFLTTSLLGKAAGHAPEVGTGLLQGGEQDCHHGWALNMGCPQSQACWGVQDVSGISESLPVGTWKRLSSVVAFWLPSPLMLCGEDRFIALEQMVLPGD